MRKSIGFITLLLLLALGAGACDTIEDIFRSRSESSPSTSNNPAEIIERLLPEEGLSRKRLRAVIEASMRVTNKNRNEFPEQRVPVRRVLQELTLKELQDIEKIVPDVEANPKLQWED